MNRINQLFESKKRNILNIYFTAGYPALDDTATIIEQLEKSGADMIEIGMPYSDPLADGPTIQRSSEAALRNGMNMDLLFEQLKNIRPKVRLPLILMGYLNQVMQYGVEAFLKQCASVGIDGLILPDLPLDEYEMEYKTLFEKYGIAISFLITPQTSEARIRKIDSLSSAFVYVVSASSTTGKKKGFAQEQLEYFEKVERLGLKSPKLIGFGISDQETFQAACAYANGAIIGSAFIRALGSEKNNLVSKIENFVRGIGRQKVGRQTTR